VSVGCRKASKNLSVNLGLRVKRGGFDRKHQTVDSDKRQKYILVVRQFKVDLSGSRPSCASGRFTSQSI